MLKTILELNKIRIIIAVVFSYLLGYVLADSNLGWKAAISTFGLLLIAGASAVLNQIQESEFDKLMPRTSKRPIPSGKLSLKSAYFIFFTELAVGSVLLYIYGGLLALIIGWITLFWYNGIYTKLKRKTPWAVIPGAVIGALPPVIGWVAAGGYVFDLKIILIAFFFFMWQIPHFWLLTLLFNDDYKKAGFPTILDLYPVNMVRKLTFLYAFATAISAMFLSLFSVVHGKVENALIVISSIGLIIVFYSLYRDKSKETKARKYFAYINVYLLLIMSFFFFNKLL